MKPSYLPPIGAGLLSGFLFLLALSGIGGGFILIHLPLIPLFIVGFALGFRPALISVVTACAVVALIGSLKALALFAVFAGLPAAFFTSRALWWRDTPAGREWYPLLSISVPLTLYAAAVFLLVAFFFSNEPGGVEGVLQRAMAEAFATAEKPVAAMMQDALSQWGFLVFALNGWIWVFMLYAMAKLAHFMLSNGSRTIRPHFSLTYVDAPFWLMLALMGAGLLTFIDGQANFIGKALFVILLLPYFLSGLTLMHQASLQWPGRVAWLSIIYIFLILSFWPCVFFVGWGLFHQWFRLSKPKGSDSNNAP